MRDRLPLGDCGERKAGHGSTTQGFVLEKLRLHARFDCPVISLAGIILWPFLLDECLVQTQVVTNAILPAWVTVLVVRKCV